MLEEAENELVIRLNLNPNDESSNVGRLFSDEAVSQMIKEEQLARAEAEAKAETERIAKEEAEAKAETEQKARKEAEARAKTAEAILKKERKAKKIAEEKVQSLKEQLDSPSFVLSTTNKTQRKIRSTNSSNRTPDIMGNAFIKSGEFSMMLENYDKGISTNAKIALDIFLQIYCKNETKDGLVTLPLSDYMEIRGLKDPKSARQQVKDCMEVLKSIKFSSSELNKTTKRKESFLNISLYGGTSGVVKGDILFRFNPDYLRFRELSHFYIEYPTEIYKINVRYFPYAYFFGCIIAENFRMNEGKQRQNIISIENLMENTPTLPSYEEISNSCRHFYDRIIEPVIRNLDQLDSFEYDFYPQGKYDDADRIDDPLSFFKGEEGNKAFFSSVIKVDYSCFPTNKERLKKRNNFLKLEDKESKSTKKPPS